MPTKQKQFFLFATVLCVGFYIVAVGAYAIWSQCKEKHELRARIDQTLRIGATSLQFLLAPDFHDRALHADSIGLPEELENRRKMNAFAAENGFKYAYTLVKDKNAFYFSAPTVTDKEAQERERWYFCPYDDLPHAFVEAYENETTKFVEYTDQWGTFRSIALPQRSPGGVKYLACVDYDISFIRKSVFMEYVMAVGTAMFFLVAGLPFLWVYRIVRKAYVRQTVEKESAEVANHMKTKFIAGISHDLRTPMQGIIGFAELIEASKDLAEARTHAAHIIDQSDHLVGLVNDLLDCSKLAAGKLMLALQPFSLANAISVILQGIERQAFRKGLAFKHMVDERVPNMLIGDELRIRQIFFNLLNNAVKFTNKGSIRWTIALKERSLDRCVLTCVIEDTGIGVAPRKIPNLFKPFEQVQRSVNYGGTGLGLTIVKELVDLMKGTVKLESKGEGTGSTVTLELPFGLVQESAAEILASNKTAPAVSASQALKELRTPEEVCRNAKVLMIEDYPVNQMIVKAHLESFGCRVTIAGSCAEALEIAADEEFDIILLDVHLPDGNGTDLIHTLHEKYAWTTLRPIVAMTASGERDVADKCRAAGMAGMIIKPVRRNDLQESLMKYLSTAHTGNDNTAAIDYRDASGRYENDTELVDASIKLFIDSVDQQIADLTNVLAQGDLSAMKKFAHTMRGGAQQIGARTVASVLEDIELSIHARVPLEQMHVLVGKLVGASTDLKNYWQKRSRKREGND